MPLWEVLHMTAHLVLVGEAKAVQAMPPPTRVFGTMLAMEIAKINPFRHHDPSSVVFYP